MFIRQNTARAIMIGPFVDNTDGYTPETALTIASGSIRLSKNGAAFAPTSAGISLTHNESGWYSGTLNTTDTNTVGSLSVAVYVTGALPVWREYTVLPAMIYNSFIGGTSSLTVYPTGVFSAQANVTGIVPAALSQIVVSGNAASWNVYNGATVTVTGVVNGLTMTASGLTPGALSQIVTSGNAANWSGLTPVTDLTTINSKLDIISGYTDSLETSVATLPTITTIVASGTAAGWAADTTAVTVSGLTAGALSQIVASGATSWATQSSLDTIPGVTVTGIFDELVSGSLDFRTATTEMWAFDANSVNLSGVGSGVLHTYKDPNGTNLFTLLATPSGRVRS